ncbi:hypothetical protein DUI87_26509 [Hirundo rustica rustica]|uniref:Uncharacterized protein n=1 Tax=Hirundo rustica rustica TaxID=333673 RepID=A0A3M0J6U4_HIRRU|nr:hypothetical protein DUI87_26509 [Hirundo rustica rustica]
MPDDSSRGFKFFSDVFTDKLSASCIPACASCIPASAAASCIVPKHDRTTAWHTSLATRRGRMECDSHFNKYRQTENCFALADASCLKSEDPPPPISILEGPQKGSDDLQLTDWHEVTREICKEENLNPLAMPVIFSQQAGGPRTWTPIPSQDMKELQKVIRDSGICSSYFKELLKNTLERTHQTIKRILSQVKRGKPKLHLKRD